MRRNIVKDTLLLTVIQMALDGLSLLLNVYMTGALGTEAIGILSLTGSFFGLSSVIASGNVFLCASRFLSEELGRKERNPDRVLRYCMGVSLVLSLLVALVIFTFAPICSRVYFQSEDLASPIRLMAGSLPLMTISACMRGYFNACCHAGICAASDTIGFLTRCLMMAAIVTLITPVSGSAICTMTAVCSIAGTLSSLLFLLWKFRRHREKKTGNSALSLRQYIKLGVPVMAGSALSSFLSSANDALVPMTLRQAGNSVSEALSQFGIFEAIVIPVLFFPSTILCSLSGILVTETARETSACNSIRITSLSEKVIRQTVVFAVFVTAVLLQFGEDIGRLMGGGEIAGTMIALLAPVVPFIYLEIVLESIIKGLGAQAFSSLNYLCEYLIRISAVLICVPLWGFYGIVISYYLSNICGNLARLCMVIRKTDIRIRWETLIGVPVFAAVFAFQLTELLSNLTGVSQHSSIPAMCISCIIAAMVYLLLQKTLFSYVSVQRCTPESA